MTYLLRTDHKDGRSFSHMFKGKTTSQLKTDVVFQIVHNIITDGKEPTPFHVMVAQGVYSLTRSKELVTALNHHRICVSYNTVKRIDVDLAERIITTAGNNRVPLPAVLEATSQLNGALDNFDRIESTLAGTGSTHDILVIFQNVSINVEKPSAESEISTSKEPTPNTKGSTVTASEVLDMLRDPSPTTTDSYAKATESTKLINSGYFLWMVNRFSQKVTHESDSVPGFTAVRSATVDANFHPTTKILTPILPYPTTTFDAIFTRMINFQDVLKQKGDAYGVYEGVYRIAKEIQLMKPDQFNNIFLGLGGFHMEKIVLAFLCTYLESSGIFDVLVETECYGTDVIKTVISGSHYARARTAHSMIHEVLTSMMLEAFLTKYPERKTELEALQVNWQSKEPTHEEWNNKKELSDTINAAFQVYLKERALQSQSFNYWNTSELFPILRDLTNSLCSGDWILYLSAMERATSLFFFGRTNYCRWTPLFLQDCYQLKKFPLLYDSYINGGFVVNTTKKGSGVPFDQALEQCYNWPVKVSGGIIGVTRKKEAVALWGIIKHKKHQYVDLLEMRDDVGGELSLHHDFNPSTTTKIVKMVQDRGISPEALGDELTQCLPALHALTGCDTTSKISTKLAALNTVRKPDNSSLILNFNCHSNRECNANGGNILGQMSQTINGHGDI
ncbi:hypothetical protein PO909_013005 [Leuciscus waleckii]